MKNTSAKHNSLNHKKVIITVSVITIATLLRGSAKTMKRNKLEKQNSITEGKVCEKLRTFIATLILQIFSVMTFVK